MARNTAIDDINRRLLNSIYLNTGREGKNYFNLQVAFTKLITATEKKAIVGSGHIGNVPDNLESYVLKSAYRNEFQSKLPSATKYAASDIFLNVAKDGKMLHRDSYADAIKVSASYGGDILEKTDQTKATLIVNKLDTSELMSADWLMHYLKTLINQHKSVQSAVKKAMHTVTEYMSKLGNTGDILGLAISASGKLSRDKQAMTKKIYRTVGQVGTSSLYRQVDYCQSMIKTKRGLVGLKVWIRYK